MEHWKGDMKQEPGDLVGGTWVDSWQRACTSAGVVGRTSWTNFSYPERENMQTFCYSGEYKSFLH